MSMEEDTCQARDFGHVHLVSKVIKVLVVKY
jgi:hypothetical protein